MITRDKYLIFLVFIILSLPFSFAAKVPIVQVFAKGNVNNSDYWDGLDTPSEIPGSTFWYNQTYSGSTYNNTYALWSYNMTSAIEIWAYNQTYSGSTYNASYLDTFNITYDTWLGNYTLFNKWWYNQTYSGSTYNASYLDTFNITYDTWLGNHTTYSSYWYNMTYSGSTYNATYAGIGSFNITYDTWLPNYTLFKPYWYNQTYSGSIFNITYDTWLGNYTLFKPYWYNQTYSGSIFNITYDTWLPNYTLFKPYWYNQTYFGSIFNITYDTWLGNYTLFNKWWYNQTYSGSTYNASYLDTYNVSYNNKNSSLFINNGSGSIYYNNGYVGLGTTTPRGVLELSGLRPLVFDTSNIGGDGYGTRFYGQGSGGWIQGYGFRTTNNTFLGEYGYYGDGNTSGYFYIGTQSNLNTTVFYPSGTVGVGLRTPRGRLGVRDNMTIEQSTYYDTIPAISTTYINGEINAVYQGSVNRGLLRLSAGGNANLPVKTAIDIQGYGAVDTSQIRYYITGTEAMRMDTNGLNYSDGLYFQRVTAGNGRLGINKYPTTQLQISGDYAGAGTAQMYITGLNTDKKLRIGFETASNYGFIQAANASAYNNLILQASGGNVGIGIATPSNKLDVHGDVNVSGDIFIGGTTSINNILKWAYNQTYSGSIFNITYDTWLPNYTLFKPYWYNQTYSGSTYNASYLDTFNITYDTWLGNHTTYSSYWYNMTPTTTINITQALYIGVANYTSNSTCAIIRGSTSVLEVC